MVLGVFRRWSPLWGGFVAGKIVANCAGPAHLVQGAPRNLLCRSRPRRVQARCPVLRGSPPPCPALLGQQQGTLRRQVQHLIRSQQRPGDTGPVPSGPRKASSSLREWNRAEPCVTGFGRGIRKASHPATAPNTAKGSTPRAEASGSRRGHSR